MKFPFKKILLFIIILVLLISVLYGSFFLYKIYSVGNKVSIDFNGNRSIFDTLKNLASPSSINLRGMDKNRINILLLGIAGKGKPGQNLTDTIMVLSINTKTNQVALISLPRDFYAKIPSSNTYTKINSIYQIGINETKSEKDGVELIKNTVSDITSLDIDYYAVLNFDGFEKAIDSIGGINITSERDIYDRSYPGPNYSYETFELKKGFHQLDGKTALKYARERHDDPEGDFGRAKRQQQVMQAAKNKIFSLKTMLNVFALNGLLDSLGDNVKTDVSPAEIEGFLELSKKLDTQNINNVVVDAWDKESLLKVSHVFYGPTRAFVLIPRVGNYSEIQELSQNVFDLNEIKRKKDEIAKESANLAIINKSGDPALPGKIKKLLSDNFGYKNVIVLNDSEKNTKDQTTSYDTTQETKPFTLNEIVKKLPSNASYELPDYFQKIIENTKTDIVVVLGKDIVERYNMEEDSIEDYKKASDDNEYQGIMNDLNK